MVRFFIYINKKPKTDHRFIFSGRVRLTEPCSPLSTVGSIGQSSVRALYGNHIIETYTFNSGCLFKGYAKQNPSWTARTRGAGLGLA